MVDGKVQVGALGCPNLPVDPTNPDGEKGIMLSVERGRGATIVCSMPPVQHLVPNSPIQRPLSSPSSPGKLLKMRSISFLSEASFCEGVESGHSSHSQQAAIAAALGITNPPVKMDSQAKYATIARGVADIYLRLPVSADYEEKIWVCLSSLLYRFVN